MKPTVRSRGMPHLDSKAALFSYVSDSSLAIMFAAEGRQVSDQRGKEETKKGREMTSTRAETAKADGQN